MHTWIKLHVKLVDHPIMRDHKALALFLHMLCICDENGNGVLSRKISSSRTGIKPAAFKKVLERLTSSHRVATTSATRYNTEFSILNWEKYQSLSNNLSTLPAQLQQSSSNTIYKEKKKKKKEREEKQGDSLFDNLDESAVSSIAEKYRVSSRVVEGYKENYILWIQSKPSDPARKGRNMRVTVQSWIRRDLDNGKLKAKQTFQEAAAEEGVTLV